MAEDHIFKRQGEPLSLEVGQPASGRQTILNLHRESTTETVWGLELNPGNNEPANEQFVNVCSHSKGQFKLKTCLQAFRLLFKKGTARSAP